MSIATMADATDVLFLRALRIADETMAELVRSEALRVPGTPGWQLCDEESKPVLRLSDASPALIEAARWLIERGACGKQRASLARVSRRWPVVIDRRHGNRRRHALAGPSRPASSGATDMSIGHHFRRLLMLHQLRKTESAAEYCRAIRRQVEQSIAHHDRRAEQLRAALDDLERRAALARMVGGS